MASLAFAFYLILTVVVFLQWKKKMKIHQEFIALRNPKFRQYSNIFFMATKEKDRKTWELIFQIALPLANLNCQKGLALHEMGICRRCQRTLMVLYLEVIVVVLVINFIGYLIQALT